MPGAFLRKKLDFVSPKWAPMVPSGAKMEPKSIPKLKKITLKSISKMQLKFTIIFYWIFTDLWVDFGGFFDPKTENM